jgi:hypothetical protein
MGDVAVGSVADLAEHSGDMGGVISDDVEMQFGDLEDSLHSNGCNDGANDWRWVIEHWRCGAP